MLKEIDKHVNCIIFKNGNMWIEQEPHESCYLYALQELIKTCHFSCYCINILLFFAFLSLVFKKNSVIC